MNNLWGANEVIHDAELARRQRENLKYLSELDADKLLLNFRMEAGFAVDNFGNMSTPIHGGWEAPTCQLRGHFLGHYLSAAAFWYCTNKDDRLISKANYIVDELEKCQEANGGEWVAPIPEKYFKFIAQGRPIWAPHYTVHKVFMGLVDMYKYTGNEKALKIADKFADWFLRYSEGFTEEEFDDILDFETGGMLEIWADLLEITNDEKYKTLLKKYYRRRLFDPLLEGKDPLTNMHANTTIPEILGCARAYEVTGEEVWKRIVEAYWNMAVTQRGYFVTGGQTLGEVWTPPHKMAQRLGNKNQEHCVVYNMIRLADALFRWTKEEKYADYIEKNIENGLMAQAYYLNHNMSNGQELSDPPTGLLTYFLPLKTGAKKGWASKTDDFFCCHGTMVQANAALGRQFYYKDKDEIYVCQYYDSKVTFAIDGVEVTLEQAEDTLSGSFNLSSTSPNRQSISDVTSTYQENPDLKKVYFKISAAKPVSFTLHFRIPGWAGDNVEMTFNGKAMDGKPDPGTFASVKAEFNDDDTIGLTFKKSIRMVPLEGSDDLYAFMYANTALAGLTDEERTIYVDKKMPESVLMHTNEREWGSWKEFFKTKDQEVATLFAPLREIGYERYTTYFRIVDKG